MGQDLDRAQGHSWPSVGSLEGWGLQSSEAHPDTLQWLALAIGFEACFSPCRFLRVMAPRGLVWASSQHGGCVQRPSVLRESQVEVVAPFRTSPQKSFMSFLLHCFLEVDRSG